MTIRRGDAWGEPVEVGAGTPTVRTDAELWHHVNRPGPGPVVLDGGDMARTCGFSADRAGQVARTMATIDLLEIRTWTPHDDFDLPGERAVAASNAVIVDGAWSQQWPAAGLRSLLTARWARREIIVAMNAQFVGELDLAPRSHPNDGRADIAVIGAAMSLRDRVTMMRRARTGTHVPHPQISEQRVESIDWCFDRARDVVFDSGAASIGGVVRLRLSVIPDALTIYV